MGNLTVSAGVNADTSSDSNSKNNENITSSFYSNKDMTHRHNVN